MKKHVLAIVLIAMGVSGLMILDFFSPYGYSIKSSDFLEQWGTDIFHCYL